MLKPSFGNILVYLFLKYIVIYGIFMVKTHNYKLLEISNIKNGEDLFYYLWIILFIPIVDMLFFSVPFYFSFKVKKGISFFILIGLILVLEYFVYVYFTSQKYIDMNGVYIELISLVVLYLFFFRKINAYMDIQQSRIKKG